MFAQPICNCLSTPTHYFLFSHTGCNASCVAGEWMSCKSLGAHKNCFLNHSRPSVLSNPFSCMLGTLQIKGLIRFNKQFSCWMAKWHCIAGTVNERALHNTKRSKYFVHSAQPNFDCIVQQSRSKDLRNSKVWSAGTFMPGSLARETSVFEVSRRLVGWAMRGGSWQTEYLFH